MSQKIPPCPVCSSPNAEVGLVNDRLIFDVECTQCGRFEITQVMLGAQWRESINPTLVAWALREASDRGQPIRITSDQINAWIKQPPRRLAVTEKIERLILWLGDKPPGTPIDIFQFPLFKVQAKDKAEIRFLYEYLIDTKLVKHRDGQGGYLSVPGIQRYEALRSPGRDHKQVFVAMWFDDLTRDAYEQGIQPAIEDCGFQTVRVDFVEHNDDIVDRIIAEIRASAFVVPDATGHRNGVYFEAGYAKGLGLDVIWTYRKDQMDGAHFDTRQLNHVVWENPADLHEKLCNRIRATIKSKHLIGAGG